MIAASSLLVQAIPYRDPLIAFAPFAHAPFAVLLDSAGDGPQANFTYIATDPFGVIETSIAAADPFLGLRDALSEFRVEQDTNALPAPFVGGAVGFIGYEVGGAFERLPPRKTPVFPFDLAFGLYDAIAAFDVRNKKAWIISSGFPERHESARFRRAEQRANQLAQKLGTAPLGAKISISDTTWVADFDEAKYRHKAESIINYIHAGDVFQANLTQRWAAPWLGDVTPFDLYRRLRMQAAAPFAAYLSLNGGNQIITASPERFLSLDARGRVETRPIKGTRRRGTTPEEDRALAAELRASAKDRAENLMIVDLLRNDLSRVCQAGSVDVPRLCGLETFPAVHHLVSVVTGQLRPECTAIDLLTACFPGGSITGTPKIRAMEIIHELEPVARGPYCGALAWLGFDGAMDSSILIRTLVRSGNKIFAQAGGGIVADSDPAQEYAESLLKARPLLMALTGHDRFTCASV